MKTRKAKKRDLREISKIFLEIFNDKPLEDKWSKKSAFKHVENEFKIGTIFTYPYKDKIIGFATVRKNIGPEWKIAEIKDFGLLENYREKGIGSIFLIELEKQLMKNKDKSICLETYSKSKAVDFYKKNKYNLSKHTAVMIKKLK